MRQTESFQKEKVKKSQKIIIYGAAVYGEIALRGLETLGLKLDCFVDRGYIGQRYLGYDVISPEELIKMNNAVVIIASLNYFGEIVEFLKNIDNIQYYDMEELMHLDYSNSRLSEYALEEVQHFEKYQVTIENYDKDAFIINHCEIVVTEKCTLKCKDCANLMQYYKKPESFEVKKIIREFNRLLQSIDLLCELRILGGEPFICKEIDELLKEYVKCHKVKRITIYTNATLIPDQNIISALANKKIAVHISDYGMCSRNINRLREILTENNIVYYVHQYEKWRDFGDLEKRNYTKEQATQLYQTCFSGKCYTFYRGRFYLCPRAAHGERLEVFQNKKSEYVDFSNEDFVISDKRKELKEVIDNVQTLTACNYCNGESVYSKEIDAAVQMKI